MSVTIQPVPDSVRLRVSGDVETTLTVPYEDDDRFLVGLSDGTLLQGLYDDRLECVWEIVRLGLGIVSFKGQCVKVEGHFEWATVSIFDANIVEPPLPAALPLFPELDRWAA